MTVNGCNGNTARVIAENCSSASDSGVDAAVHQHTCSIPQPGFRDIGNGAIPTESPQLDNSNSEASTPDKNLNSDDTLQDGSQTPQTVPSHEQLLEAVLEIRTEAPTLGVPKLLLKLKRLNPCWQISEKRLRKFLNSNPNLSPQATRHQPRPTSRPPCEPMWLPNYAWEKDWEAASAEQTSTEPLSSLDDTLLLECRQRSVKVEPVRFPANNKGSGLIAKDHIPKSTQIIKEDAFVWVPQSKAVSRSVISGQNCAFCGRAFSMQRIKNQLYCPHHPAPGSKEAIASQQLVTTTSTSLTTGSQSVTEKPAGPEPCYMRYCTRVCAQKSVDHYGPLVCPQKNPEYMQLIRFSDSEEFRGAHIVFKLFARLLIANELGPISLNPAFRAPEDKPEIAEASRGADSKVEPGTTTSGGDAELDQAGSDDPAVAGNRKVKKAKSKKKVSLNPKPESSGTSVEFEKVFSRIQGLATISDRARREKFFGGGHLGSHFTDAKYGQMWRTGWHTAIRALHLDTGYRPPTAHKEMKSTDAYWETFWKRRLKSDIIAHYFGLKGFLEFAGKAALNRESDHGLYLLHSRFNHSCDPNAAVLKYSGAEEIHKTAPSTIYVVSKRDVAKDEEITLSYVNSDLPMESRRKKLFEEYLFSCFCSRCRRELQEEESKQQNANPQVNGKETLQDAGGATVHDTSRQTSQRTEADESMISELRAAFS